MLALILLLSATLPSPSPAASIDPCGGTTTDVLATMDRPTVGFSACSVKKGESLSEIGYGIGAQSDGSRTVTYPQGFLRFGVAPNLEINFIGPAYAIVRGVKSQRGFLDSGLGMKYEWTHDPASAFATDFLYTIPSGSGGFTVGAPVATLNLDYGYSLSPVVGFGTTIGLQSSFASNLAGNNARFFSMLPSAVITAKTSSRTQWYAEAFGQTKIRPDGGSLLGMDGGVQYLLAPQLEIDLEGARTVTDVLRAYSYAVGFGIKL